MTNLEKAKSLLRDSDTLTFFEMLEQLVSEDVLYEMGCDSLADFSGKDLRWFLDYWRKQKEKR